MGISQEQQAFLDVSGKVVLCACPGSGKTYIVSKKLIQYLKIWSEPHQGVAALSFTNVASEEIGQQVNSVSETNVTISYPHFVGTIDSFLDNYIFFRFGYLLMNELKRPKIIVDDISIPFSNWERECYKSNCVANIKEFRWGIDNNTYKKDKIVTCDGGEDGRPCDQYKLKLKRSGIFFQNDVPMLCYEILKNHPEIASAVTNRFPVIILDEAQDASVEQMAVLDLLANAGLKEFYLVGDPDQAIYEWRSATPECFTDKMRDNTWKTKYLNENRRNSQNICNATYKFSSRLANKAPNIAVGNTRNFKQKPELILIKSSTSKESVCQYFLERCNELEIPQSCNSIAILTRGKIHNNTNINNLWKSKEIYLLARASFEWQYGSRKKAYIYCEQCLYSMMIDDAHNISVNLSEEIEKIISYDKWKENVLNLVCNLPASDIPLKEWIKIMKTYMDSIKYPFSLRNGHAINEIIEIKKSDKKVPNFKDIPVSNFFQKETKTNVTISTIHGVKGKTFEAVLLYAPSITGNTITRSLLTKGDLNNELMRAAYVAMTRPKKYLAVAIAKPSKKTEFILPRFPKELWNYIDIEV